MRRVDGFAHRPGHHCGSTSLRNLADYYGWAYDEPSCFGLASGLGFTFFDLPESPHRAFFGRPLWLERAFFERLAIGHDHRSGQDWDDFLASLQARLDADDPALVFTDIFYLDYYQTDTHFAPHSLLAIGYDEDDETVLLADSEFETPQRLPVARLRAAMTSEYMLPDHTRSLVVTDPNPGATFAEAAPMAIAETARYMLDPPAVDRELGPGTHGLAGIRAFADELPDWTAFEDPQWTVRFAYQNVERRGTGGGCFRRMYAEFLDAAAEAVPSVPQTAADEMADIAADWTAVGETLKRASECDDTAEMDPYLTEAADGVHDLADREQRLFEELLAAVS